MICDVVALQILVDIELCNIYVQDVDDAETVVVNVLLLAEDVEILH